MFNSNLIYNINKDIFKFITVSYFVISFLIYIIVCYGKIKQIKYIQFWLKKKNHKYYKIFIDVLVEKCRSLE